MGLILCGKHGRSGITPACQHLQAAVRKRAYSEVIPKKVRLYLDQQPKGPPEIYYFVCLPCAEKIRGQFGGLEIFGEDSWEKSAEIVDPEAAVCWNCLREVFPEVENEAKTN